MKKLVLLLAIILMGTNCSFADDFSAEVAAIRVVKEAKINVLNKQIKEHTQKVSEIMANESLSAEQKENLFKKEHEKILVLTKEKSHIQEQYLIDKKAIKKRYK